jgi:urease accessory protein
MSWHGHLSLNYTRDGERTIALDRHDGPLRVLQRLYPEGPGICHHVLVHPPGGIVGGDILEVNATLQAHTHALISTPGATRFYRSAGQAARQSVAARLKGGARLEWLPLETIAYQSSIADNHLRFELDPGAEMIGWDLLALGLPAAGEHFDAHQGQHGRYTQSIEIPGAWLERGTISAVDHTLLDSPLGWAGHRVMGTMWFAAGHALAGARREALLDQARELITSHAPTVGAALHAGATSPHEQVVIVRALADKVEPLMALMAGIWGRWREAGWGIKPCAPRVWRT